MEVIAIGAELDTVLRADRVLQLWAAAEPGKVVEGLTVKQEMRAIKEAIAKRNREFLGQYGGLIQAGERYKELLTLPEAELAEGVSIDGYSTVPGNPIFGAGLRGQIRGVFRGTGGRILFAPGTKGGVW